MHETDFGTSEKASVNSITSGSQLANQMTAKFSNSPALRLIQLLSRLRQYSYITKDDKDEIDQIFADINRDRFYTPTELNHISNTHLPVSDADSAQNISTPGDSAESSEIKDYFQIYMQEYSSNQSSSAQNMQTKVQEIISAQNSKPPTPRGGRPRGFSMHSDKEDNLDFQQQLNEGISNSNQININNSLAKHSDLSSFVGSRPQTVQNLRKSKTQHRLTQLQNQTKNLKLQLPVTEISPLALQSQMSDDTNTDDEIYYQNNEEENEEEYKQNEESQNTQFNDGENEQTKILYRRSSVLQQIRDLKNPSNLLKSQNPHLSRSNSIALANVDMLSMQGQQQIFSTFAVQDQNDDQQQIQQKESKFMFEGLNEAEPIIEEKSVCLTEPITSSTNPSILSSTSLSHKTFFFENQQDHHLRQRENSQTLLVEPNEDSTQSLKFSANESAGQDTTQLFSSQSKATAICSEATGSSSLSSSSSSSSSSLSSYTLQSALGTQVETQYQQINSSLPDSPGTFLSPISQLSSQYSGSIAPPQFNTISKGSTQASTYSIHHSHSPQKNLNVQHPEKPFSFNEASKTALVVNIIGKPADQQRLQQELDASIQKHTSQISIALNQDVKNDIFSVKGQEFGTKKAGQTSTRSITPKSMNISASFPKEMDKFGQQISQNINKENSTLKQNELKDNESSKELKRKDNKNDHLKHSNEHKQKEKEQNERSELEKHDQNRHLSRGHRRRSFNRGQDSHEKSHQIEQDHENEQENPDHKNHHKSQEHHDLHEHEGSIDFLTRSASLQHNQKQGVNNAHEQTFRNDNKDGNDQQTNEHAHHHHHKKHVQFGYESGPESVEYHEHDNDNELAGFNTIDTQYHKNHQKHHLSVDVNGEPGSGNISERIERNTLIGERSVSRPPLQLKIDALQPLEDSTSFSGFIQSNKVKSNEEKPKSQLKIGKVVQDAQIFEEITTNPTEQKKDKIDLKKNTNNYKQNQETEKEEEVLEIEQDLENENDDEGDDDDDEKINTEFAARQKTINLQKNKEDLEKLKQGTIKSQKESDEDGKNVNKSPPNKKLEIYDDDDDDEKDQTSKDPFDVKQLLSNLSFLPRRIVTHPPQHFIPVSIPQSIPGPVSQVSPSASCQSFSSSNSQPQAKVIRRISISYPHVSDPFNLQSLG
ncbi:MAG: hypothetical protein EZS28_001226 [Streblomastix strix]|uniref:Uncharacterized protein n=1 Tax=Streblomastix strix TaxID=222440 RepID=A0A5J4X7U9_9EUKA|nr:MAG: hypothetical protein EZS28_001226 [Streblomastix strix]